MSTAPYIAMARNNNWANRTLGRAVAGLSPDIFTAARPGFFGSLAATLDHIYEVDLYYVDALEAGGLGRSVYERTPLTDPKTLLAAQTEVDLRLTAFCDALTVEALAESRTTERADGMVEERVDALLLHLFQHQIHHRGQAHAMLSHAGIDPPQLDDFYLDFGRAEDAEGPF